MKPKVKSGNNKLTIKNLEDRVAKKVVSESLRLKSGDSLTVETWNNGLELARRVAIEARKVGAHPILIFEDEDAYVEGVKNTPKDSLGKMGKHEYQMLSATDAYFFIPNEILEPYTKRLSESEVNDSTSYGDSWYEAAEKAGLRGARMSFGFAGKELAKMLGKKLDEIIIHQLKATLTDFEALRKVGRDLESRMPSNSTGVLESGGLRLEFEFGEKGARIEDGMVDEGDISSGYNVAYLPPGVISKGVKSDSVNGKVGLSPTLTWRGIVEGAVLEFEKGRLVSWTSNKASKEKLDYLINVQSESDRKIGGVTIGLNSLVGYGYGQDRFALGSLGVSGLEFTGILRKGTLRVDQTVLVEKGKLSIN